VTRPPRRLPPPRTADEDEGGHADEGRAIIEVIWLAVLVLIPVAYILISVLQVQSTSFAVAQAARDAGRIIDTAPSVAAGVEGALAAARQTLTDQHLASDDLSLTFTAAGAGCDGPQVAPVLTAGETFDICVVAPLRLPLLPAGLTASNTVSGVYTYHVGEFREAR
jgi:hypothetical protein